MGKLIRILAVLLLCAGGYWVHTTLDLSMDAVLKETRIRVESSGAWGPVLFIGLCIGGVLMHGPEILVVAFGGLLFPRLQAISYGWIGVILGSSLTFFLSRYLLRDSIQRHVIARFPKLKSLDDQFESNGFRTVLILRLILFMSPPLNWALGATRVRFVHYLFGTMLGVLPGIILTVTFAEQISAIESWGDVMQPHVLIPVVVVVAFIVVTALVARRFFVPANNSNEA